MARGEMLVEERGDGEISGGGGVSVLWDVAGAAPAHLGEAVAR